MKNITVIIPTYNEEDYIEDCLKSLHFAHQIIVIDSYSNDNTVAIAENYNCDIILRKFDNFSNQKNAAIEKATGEWLLFLDADERITPKLQIEILNTTETPKYLGYKLRFPHFYMNRFLYHTENKVTRLVENNNVYFTGDVHEKLNHNGETGILQAKVLHYTYKGLFCYIKKKDSYAWFQAKMGKEKNKKAGYFQLIFKPFYRFFHTYIIRRGIFDGVPGLAVAVIDSYGVFSRYVKMLLLEKNSK